MELSEALVEPASKKFKLEANRCDGDGEKPICLYGSGCYRRSPAHLRAYRHPKKERDLTANLPHCKYGAHCYDRNLLHFAMFYHPTFDCNDGQANKSGNIQLGLEEANRNKQSPKHAEPESTEVGEHCNKSVWKDDAVLARGPSIVETYSIMTEEQRRDLIKKAFEMKQELRQKLNDTENILKAKTEELEMLRLKLDRNSLMVEGEEEAMRGDKIKYFQLYPQRNFKEESAAEIHFRLAESQFYRLLPAGSACKVTKVEYVVQPLLMKRFNDARRSIKEARNEDSSYPVLGFHGTEEKNIESICETGFRVPGEEGFQHATDPGWYGKGVYFSEYPRYSMNYIKDSSKLLLCQILPGKVYRCRYIIQGESLRPGFDSHVSPDGKEVVIFNSHHILPSYIVHYTVIQGDFCYEKNE